MLKSKLGLKDTDNLENHLFDLNIFQNNIKNT